MLFNSWQFVAFFLIVYAIYVCLSNYRYQNLLLLAASYYFYAAWDWRFLALLLGSTLLDYVFALASTGARTRACGAPFSSRA